VKIVKKATGFSLINIYIDFESRSWLGVLDTTLCDKVCQSLAAGRRYLSPDTLVSSANIFFVIYIISNLNINEFFVSELNRC
jgi:hypothetical protein